MKTRRVDFGHFSADVDTRWEDLTSTLDQPDLPLTLANPDSGVGALQFSAGLYKSGKLPHFTKQDLFSLLDDFAVTERLETPFDRHAYPDCDCLIGESFYRDGDFIRVWYFTDGKNIMLITYLCDWPVRELETEPRETTVRSIRFNNVNSGSGSGKKWKRS